ncbi:MAG: HlyD family efflux transporter periplasmic adaptor subunit [Clostridiales bacterium]|nr:HlyD family efflux transporter periplasmic adaptor subunit [Clostridiales bacterium]
MSENPVDESRNSTKSNTELIKMQRDMRKRKKRKIIIIVLISVVAVFALIVFLISMAMNAINDMINKTYLNVEQAQVTRSDLSQYVESGGGIGLADISFVDIRNSLEVDEVFVEEGDKVTADTMLMTVTESSLMDAISQVQGKIDSLDDSIADVSDDKISGKVKAPLEGRVKLIYCKEEDSVADTVCDNGALIVLSLDGKMTCDVPETGLKAGDQVKVFDKDGNEYKGQVSRVKAGKAQILVSDKVLMPDDKVTVKDENNNTIADAQVQINKPLSITGYKGTVKTIKCKAGDKVKAGDVLLTLSDTKISADYDSLLKQRKEQEDILNEYLKIYKEGGIFAGEAGVIKTIYDPDAKTEEDNDDDMSMNPADYADYMGQDTGSDLANIEDEEEEVEAGYTRVARISPNTTFAANVGIAEKDILKIKEGMKAKIEIEAIDYKGEGKVTEISDEPSDKQNGIYTATIEFEKTDEMLTGMYAAVKIEVNSADNVLSVKTSAIRKSGNGEFVYTEYNSETREFGGMVYVTTGLSNDDFTEIKDGLKEGDTVYYESDRSAMSDMMYGEETSEETEEEDPAQAKIDEHNAAIASMEAEESDQGEEQ